MVPTCEVIVGVELNDDAVIPVLEAIALHVGPIVVPHHSHLQFGRHLQ